MPKRFKSEATVEQDPLAAFHPAVREWFNAVFEGPTRPQQLSWPAIARGESTLLLAPTGTGKTLSAFLWCLNRLMFSPEPPKQQRCRILYISPIKALAVDVERNLRAPLAGIAQAAQRRGDTYHEPAVAIRTGDTPSAERARFARSPADILITTPESLYLLLTSNAREVLRSIETVIVDEIHALVPTKRGAHLALSLERLQRLCARPLQRVGLSATQRPLDEVAHFLAGANPSASAAPSAEDTEQQMLEQFADSTAPRYRDVTIIDASERKRLDLCVEVPVEDMAKLGEIEPIPSGPASQGPVRQSIWSSIHPKLLELVRAHQSTLIFVNSRRLAERISGAINDLAGETLVQAHHGSVAVAQRKEIEDRLKLGQLRGLVATSSLELGIDMGAVDLVVQIEAPPSVASGMQRIGRANHHVGGTSEGIIFPKYRADLLACASVTRAMQMGEVESVRYPRNPLDVLAQQIVAAVAMDAMTVDELFALVRSAAPFASLTRLVFEGVLDLLSGRYPSDEFAELRPRITWDRVTNQLTPREGAKRIAIVNGGTIPDRGLYGVFLAGATKPTRVGELDEEMVFESRPGDTIILGASTWRIEEITHDRVLVVPAPGEPGKMPFWHGDQAGRPAEFGRRIGTLTRELLHTPRPAAYSRLVDDHALDANAAENLLRYLEDQRAATTRVPSDEDILIERCKDELGDWRICVLTPFGSRVHAPWCMAVAAALREDLGVEPESMWSDDGFVIRLPENDQPLESERLVPDPAEVYSQVVRQLGSTALFAAKFRENAGRALLLPKRRPGVRAPLWQQRKRAADLMNVASRYASFAILLETYRECIRDVFDLPALVEILRKVRRGEIRVTSVESVKPSPFAASLLFSYVANYIYDGDAPLAERRAQALSIDQSQLQELLGDADYRELLDPAALDEVEAQLQLLEPEQQARSADAVHDLLLRLGDLSAEELERRCATPEVFAGVKRLQDARRVLLLMVGGERRYVPVEYAAQYRDALGVPLPPGLAEVWLRKSADPLHELLSRYSRTHGPFTLDDIANRYSLSRPQIETGLRELVHRGRLLEGEFRPGGVHREWVNPDVLQQVRRKTLAKLRREVEPVDKRVLGVFLPKWQGVGSKRRGLDALLDAIESLQGAALPASELEREILPARVRGYTSSDLDTLMAAGEVVWVGVERIGERDGRIALYLSESLPMLLPPSTLREAQPESERSVAIIDFLRREGASFFAAIHDASGGGFPGDTSDALWDLAWRGIVTNDTFHSVRNFLHKDREGRAKARADDPRPGSPEFLKRFRARTRGGSVAQGRWSLVQARVLKEVTPTEWSANTAQQLLVRHGIVMRETAAAEDLPGGFSAIYPALRSMEEGGWVRRGMFVAGLGGSQFAMNAAVDLLRSSRTSQEIASVHLAASDPANPYGTLLPWSRSGDSDESHGMSRTSGASVILVSGELTAFLRRRNAAIKVFLPDDDPERTAYARATAKELAEVAIRRQGLRSGLLITEINGQPAREHLLGRFLEEAGFVLTALGYQMRRVIRTEEEEHEEDILTEDSEAENA